MYVLIDVYLLSCNSNDVCRPNIASFRQYMCTHIHEEREKKRQRERESGSRKGTDFEIWKLHWVSPGKAIVNQGKVTHRTFFARRNGKK